MEWHKPLEKIVKLSVPVRVLLVLFIVILLGVVVFFFVTEPVIQDTRTARTKEAALKIRLEKKQSIVADTSGYQSQAGALESELLKIFERFPTQAEMQVLLDDITKTAISSGLKVVSFKPAGDIQKTFYRELPVHVVLWGHYHQFGSFISHLSQLKRIVNLKDFKIQVPDKRGAKQKEVPAGVLEMTMTLNIYRRAGGMG